MMNISFRHLALVVSDLRAAEEYYQSIFNMELIGREAELDNGLWYTLPIDKGWDAAEAAGIELGMLALRKDQFVLALIKGEAPLGQVHVIGLKMPMEEIAKVKARLPQDAQVTYNPSNQLEFRDPYQIIWQISVPESEFQTSGDRSNRWLSV
jgi:catechol 2,3-dioxygenase-like lactoylglutathione lyase family enzyme